MHVQIANQKKRLNARSKFVSVFPLKSPEPGLVWGLFSANCHTFNQELALITNFKKVDVPNMKNPTDVEYHNT